MTASEVVEATGSGEARRGVLAVLTGVLAQEFNITIDARAIASDEPLQNLVIEGVHLDSMDFLIMALAIEAHFDREIDDESFSGVVTWGDLVELLCTYAQLAQEGARE